MYMLKESREDWETYIKNKESVYKLLYEDKNAQKCIHFFNIVSDWKKVIKRQMNEDMFDKEIKKKSLVSCCVNVGYSYFWLFIILLAVGIILVLMFLAIEKKKNF